jgi:regulator of sigma E protease
VLLTLASLLVVLGVLVFIHELGHFLAAKWAGIYVHRFSVGIGAPIKALSFRRGETEYALSWLPLGGYVRMASREEDATSTALEGGDEPLAPVPADRMFEAKPVWKRIVVILAGVTMNALFAWAVFSWLAHANGRAVNPVTVVGGIDSAFVPAGAEGLYALRAGDRITAVNGAPVRSWGDIETALQQSPGDSLRIALDDGRAVTVPVHADQVEERMQLAVAVQPFTAPVTGRVIDGRPAARAGMQRGDTIVAIDGAPVSQWREVLSRIERSPGVALALTLGRPSGRTTVEVRPDSTRVDTGDGGERWVGKIGVEVFAGTRFEPYPSVWAAIGAGGRQTLAASTTIVRTVRGMLSGRVSSRSVGGPIAIGQMAGETARLGLDAFLAFMAIISVNLAVLNLLPIPVLDGGQLLFLLAEALTGRPLPLKVREKLTLLGLALVATLMALAFWNDIRRVLEQVLK